MIQIQLTDLPAEFPGALTHDLAVAGSDGNVPGALWLPEGLEPKGLILYGHGGSRHKREASVVQFAERAVQDHQFAVASIDGPIHGARRSDVSVSPPDIQAAFLSKWQSGDNGVACMVKDWQLTLDALMDRPELGGLPVGYFGLSMGHAYGVPFIAQERRIQAAVIGLWGANYPGSDHLVAAAREVSVPTLSFHMREDTFFTLDGGVALFDALPSDDKQLTILPGPHELNGIQTRLGLAFLKGWIAPRKESEQPTS